MLMTEFKRECLKTNPWNSKKLFPTKYVSQPASIGHCYLFK